MILRLKQCQLSFENIFDRWELPKGIQENYLLRRSYDNHSEYYKIITTVFFKERKFMVYDFIGPVYSIDSYIFLMRLFIS